MRGIQLEELLDTQTIMRVRNARMRRSVSEVHVYDYIPDLSVLLSQEQFDLVVLPLSYHTSQDIAEYQTSTKTLNPVKHNAIIRRRKEYNARLLRAAQHYLKSPHTILSMERAIQSIDTQAQVFGISPSMYFVDRLAQFSKVDREEFGKRLAHASNFKFHQQLHDTDFASPKVLAILHPYQADAFAQIYNTSVKPKDAEIQTNMVA